MNTVSDIFHCLEVVAPMFIDTMKGSRLRHWRLGKEKVFTVFCNLLSVQFLYVRIFIKQIPVFCIFPLQYALCMAGIHVVQRTQFYIFQTDEKLTYAWVTLSAAAAGKLLVDTTTFVDS